ncbi:MAG: TIM barrel protein, partial [Myxococcota bacterium]
MAPLTFAPHLGLTDPAAGMFVEHGGSLEGQIRFAHAAGFRALEDNFYKARSPEDQQIIIRTLRELDMRMGVFVATFSTASPMHGRYGADQPSFASSKSAHIDAILQELEDSLTLARSAGAQWLTVLSGGEDPTRDRAYQTAQMVETLRLAAPTAERAGVGLAIEPINRRDWPGTFPHTVAQGYQVVRAVDHPSIK